MRQTIIRLLDSLSIPHRVLDHPAVFTVAESQLAIEDKTPVKNLFLTEQKGSRQLLVILPGHDRLDTKQLAAQTGTGKLQFGKPEAMLAALGTTPGSVSLFCLLHDGSKDVEVVIDHTLLEAEELGFHPGTNTATIFIPGNSVPKIVEHTGHKLQVI